MSSNIGEMMSVQRVSNVEEMDTDTFARTPQMKRSSDSEAKEMDSSSSDTQPPNVMAQPGAKESSKTTVGDPGPPASSTAAAASQVATSSASGDVVATTDLDLLLIGKSGVGKSATGNSILGRKVFKSSASLNSETLKISSDVSKVNGQIIKVVDGPGVGDTRMDTEEGTRLFVDSMEHAMITNPAGYHAFLLVLRFGTRFTQEDIDTIALLKKVFGPDFVKNYCILVMTCGDMFKYEAEENEVDFPQWVGLQTGAMAELVKECQNRIVLFDNTTKKQEEKAAQVETLLESIKSLNNNGKRYTDANFECAMDAREKVIAESKVPLARDATLQSITLLMQELGAIRLRGAESDDIATSEAILHDLEKLLKDAAIVRQDVIEQDKGTGALKDLIQSVETVEKSIKSSLELHQIAVESRRKQQESETEVSSRMRELQEQIESAKAEDVKRKLEEENKMLKLKLERMAMEREEEKRMFRDRHTETWRDLNQCQNQFQAYRIERDMTIFQSIKIVVRVVKKKFTKVMKNFFL